MDTETYLSDMDRLRKAVTALEGQLRALVGDLVGLQERLAVGDLQGLADSKRRAGEIREWLRIAVEMEIRLEKRNEERSRRSGAGGGIGAIDLERARSEIGCRLDRLRRSRCPNGFPRKPE